MNNMDLRDVSASKKPRNKTLHCPGETDPYVLDDIILIVLKEIPEKVVKGVKFSIK